MSAPVGFFPLVEEGVPSELRNVVVDGKKEIVMMRTRSTKSERKVKSELDLNSNRAPMLQRGEVGGEPSLDETDEWAKVGDNYCSLE